MIARITIQLPCDEAELWSRITRPRSLQYVTRPILRFVPLEDGALDGDWEVGKPYDLKLYLFQAIPLGRHRIRLLKVDERTRTILSEESGLLARVWNHVISFHRSGDRTVAYTDEIQIEAGWLTPLVWAFAHLFYRHRQRRWKRLLERAR